MRLHLLSTLMFLFVEMHYQIYKVLSLELLELRVPSHVPLGTRAQLSCCWQLGPADVLYSVKWYKDGKEFFRHVPRDVEPPRKFPLPGVDVERSDVNGSSVTINPVSMATGGRYRCEVSGEGPLFPTVSDHKDMFIVVLPLHGPIITGSRPRYMVGDRVHVNCTSPKSRPATNLTWYVNSERAPRDFMSPLTTSPQDDGLQSTTILLRFVVTPRYCQNDAIKLKCLATIASVYWRSNEESAQCERMKPFRTNLSQPHDNEITRADRVQASNVAYAFNNFQFFVITMTVVLVLIDDNFCLLHQLI